MIRKSLLMFSAAALFIACSKDDKNDSPPKEPTDSSTPASAYYPMKVGSYWVYDVYEIDSNGTEAIVGHDSIAVTKDTLIHGKTFFKVFYFFSHC